jgi:hypothetical protein
MRLVSKLRALGATGVPAVILYILTNVSLLADSLFKRDG